MQTPRHSLVSCFSAMLLLLMGMAAHATDYYVNAVNGNDSNTGLSASAAVQYIQTAINAANPGDTLHVAAGTYPEKLEWRQKDLTITGAGAGQSVVDTSSVGSGRCLYTNNLTAASHISGFTFQGANSGEYGAGGGMFNDHSSPTVANCTFSGNTSYSHGGGGMFNSSNSNPTLTNCTFSGNTSYGPGGGMYNESNSSPTLTNCTFAGNQSSSNGGGIVNVTSNPTFSNCTFTGNSSGDYGGAMASYGSSLTITNCTFTGNQANNSRGGAMDTDGSNLTITNCVFTANQARDGGGMYNTNGGNENIVNCTFMANQAQHDGGGMSNDNNTNPTLTNCTFTANQSLYNNGGGMIDVNGSSPTVINCTFIGNRAPNFGGGIATWDGSTLTVTNSIVWGNSARTGNGIFNGSNVILHHSDVEGYGLSGTANADGNFAADPRLVRNPAIFFNPDGSVNGAQSDYGDLHLQFGSPAIDAGNDAAVTVPPCLPNAGGQPTDLDGNARISRAHVDLGAYEYQNRPPTVNAGGAQTVTATHSGNPANDTASLTLAGSATDPENDAFTFAWTDSRNTVVGQSASLPLTLKPGTYSYTLTATDAYGASGSQSVQVTVNPAPNRAPTANAGKNQTVTANGATASVTLDGSGSSDPEGDMLSYAWSENGQQIAQGVSPTVALSLGVHTITLTVTDAYGAFSTAQVTVKVVDATPPTVTASANQTQLWPPNGKTVPVIVSGKVTDSGSGVDLASGSYTVQDSEGTYQPTGTFTINPDGTYSVSVPLVASRNGNNKAGRTYTITITARDKTGNVGKATVTVTVPHDQGH